MSLPASVREVTDRLGAEQRALTEEAVALVQQNTGRARTPESWQKVVARIGPDLLRIQVAQAELADPYLAEVLQAQGAPAGNDGAAVNAEAWRDYTDGGGSLLLNLLYSVNAIPRRGVASDVLQGRVSDLATSIVLTAMQDTSRAAIQTGMQTHTAVTAYTRALTPPSCARCVLLAGRVYHRAAAFRRHPRCNCYNVPTAEDVAGDWTTDPVAYFRALPATEQDRVFTQTGAEAIRLGGVTQAGINQVVNARAGISTVTAYGRELQVTTVGTTKRAVFGGYEVLADGTVRRRTGAAAGRAREPRLLPDEIFQLSEEFGWDRAATLRQLRRYAYVL